MINKEMIKILIKFNFWPGTEYYSVRLMSSSRENLECWLDESLVIADWTDSSIRRQNNPIPIEPTQIERTENIKENFKRTGNKNIFNRTLLTERS